MGSSTMSQPPRSVCGQEHARCGKKKHLPVQLQMLYVRTSVHKIKFGIITWDNVSNSL